MNSIPKGWLGCPKLSVAEPIGGTFIAFKTPLSQHLNGNVPPAQRFFPADVFNHALENELNITLWVDLTNTSRYYSSSEVSRRDGTKYVKMAMEGRGRTLPPSEINKFVDMCDDVNAGDEGAIVGVHCTHGFNRTGYLICTYLILRRGYGVEQALLEFRDKRPPGIYRPEYVRELLKLHGAANPEIFGVFSPYWDKKDEIKGGLDPRKFRMEEFPYPELKVRFEFHLTEVLRDFNRAMGGYRFRSDAVQQLTVGTRLDDRLVTWISRGHSFYLFVGMQNCVYLIGEQNLVWKVENLAFPNFREGHLYQTVLSGELTRIEGPNGSILHAFIISDILSLLGDSSVQNLPLNQRRVLVKEYVLNPRSEAIRVHRLIQSIETFGLRTKPYFQLGSLHQMLHADFNFRLELPPKLLAFVSQRIEEKPMVWSWQSAYLKVGSKSDSGKIELTSVEGEVVSHIDSSGGVGDEGSVVLCSWRNKNWTFVKAVQGILADNLRDIKNIETSINETAILSLL